MVSGCEPLLSKKQSHFEAMKSAARAGATSAKYSRRVLFCRATRDNLSYPRNSAQFAVVV